MVVRFQTKIKFSHKILVHFGLHENVTGTVNIKTFLLIAIKVKEAFYFIPTYGLVFKAFI